MMNTHRVSARAVYVILLALAVVDMIAALVTGVAGFTVLAGLAAAMALGVLVGSSLEGGRR